MRKRITSLLLTLAMLLSLLPAMGVTASAADDTSYTQAEIRNYNTFASYLRSFDSRDLKLTKDINYTVGIDDDSIYVMCNQKLDLNGHKITIDASKRAGFENLLCIRRGEFTLYDSKGGGELAVSFPNDDKAYSIIMMSSEKKDEPSKFTMNGGTLTKLSPNMTYTYGASGCIGDDYFNKPENGKRSQITINGGTINCSYAYKWDRSKPLLSLPVKAMPLALQLLYSNLTINGGTFNGIVWTDLLWRGTQDTEPRVVLNGGEFNAPFVVEDMQRTATQMVIDGAHFNDGFYVDDGDSKNTDVGTVPQLLLKSGVFTSPDKNPKLDIYNVTAAHGDSSITKNRVILHAMKCFPNSAIKVNGNIYTSENINSLVKSNDKGYYLKLNSNTPIEVIRDAWGVMESVTLDGTKTINYAKDWKGAVEEMDNSTAHTIKFTWKSLADELKNAGYSYRVECDRYISGNKTPTTDPISATANEYSFTIPAGADPKVYSFDLQLNLKKGDNNIGIISNEHIVKLVVSKAPPAPPEPPAPVAHSIKITNGRGTANTTSAFAGDTVTVTAKDDTANNMMFTRWYAKTAGVTFADATQKKTTFTMPDCDVEVNPGFQQVSFTRQPIDSWLSSADDSNVYFAFSQPITSWKLVNENDQTLASGDAADANALVAAALARRDKGTVMTCRVIVTSNGQNFTSQTFDLKWYDVPGAPDVTVYPAGGKFVETLDVNLETPNTYWWILYTTDGSDPYDKSGENWTKTSSAIEADDSTHVTISKSTTIKACLYNPEGHSNMERFGDIATCDFTKVELTPPVADPVSGTSFYDSLNISLSTDIVNAKIKWASVGQDVEDLGNPSKWFEYDPNSGIAVGDTYGTSRFCAVTCIRMERDDGSTYWVHSDTQEYLYPRITYAIIADASVTGKVNEEITPVDVSITLSGDVFAEDLTAGANVSDWFTNLPIGLKATVKEKTNYTKTLVITISGTPKAVSAAAISVEMPKSALRYTGTGTAVEQTVLSNPKAYYSIVAAAAHTHDTGNRSWASLNDYEHYRNCTAGDDPQFEPHNITSWTDNGDGTHTGTCTVCGYKKTESIPATGGGSSSGGGSSGGGGAGVTTYAITVQNSKNGTVTASHKSAAKDTAVTLTVTPDKGYVLDTLTVLDSKDKAIKLTEKNGKYTFTMPSGKVTVSAAFKAAAPASENPFTDVPSGAYYEDAVIWAVKKGITSGTSAVTFDPDGNCTRAQAVTFLWRAAGSPEPKSATMPFTDVPAGSYFEKAVLWAVENGITKGTSDTTFGPDASCTRAQIVTFLWRANGSHAVSGNSAFTDVASDAYYAAAVAWAEKNGVTGGIGGGLFGSDNTCTRAQIVTFLHRAMK